MIRRPPRSTQSRSSAASDVYKRQVLGVFGRMVPDGDHTTDTEETDYDENGDDPVVVYAATDPEEQDVTWSIVPADEADANSPDEDDFEMTNGVLTFEDPPDFETPSDRAGTEDNLVTDNTYVVQVRASPSEGPHHTITVTVNVQNCLLYTSPSPRDS